MLYFSGQRSPSKPQIITDHGQYQLYCLATDACLLTTCSGSLRQAEMSGVKPATSLSVVHTHFSVGMCGMDFTSSVQFRFGFEKNHGFGSVLKRTVGSVFFVDQL